LAFGLWLERIVSLKGGAFMTNYKDLRVWDEAHKLTLTVYRITHVFPKEERFGLTSQVRRASASIAANLAEGCGKRSDGEMARFVQIAMGQAQNFPIIFCWRAI
jgi:23S rRNA-intervening sequence protein